MDGDCGAFSAERKKPDGDLFDLDVMAVAENYNRDILSLLPITPGRLGSMLDFGAGIGTMAELVRKTYGQSPACVETEPGFIQALMRRGFSVFSQIQDVPSQSIELCWSINVLEHIVDDLGALREMRRVMMPGGRVLIYVPAMIELYGPWDIRVGHVWRYRLQELQDLVAKAGFGVVRGGYMDSLGAACAWGMKRLAATGNLSAASVRFYDRYAYPCSRLLDRLNLPFGKNVWVEGIAA